MDSTATQNLHHSFVELENLEKSPKDGKLRWIERARWIKFEEDVDIFTNQWSAPFVPALSLKAVSELKTCIKHGCVCIGVKGNTLPAISRRIMQQMMTKNLLRASSADDFIRILLARHEHIRKKIDAPRIAQKWLSTTRGNRVMPRRNTIVPVQSVNNAAR